MNRIELNEEKIRQVRQDQMELEGRQDLLIPT